MQTVNELEQLVRDAGELSGQDRIAALEKARGGVSEIERRAMVDPAFPLSEILAARALLQLIDTGISRTQGAMRAASARRR